MIPIPLNTASRVGLNVLLLLAGVIALYYGEPVFVPVLIALLFATVLGPAAVWLNRSLKIRWGLACITVIFGLVMVNLLITAVFSASVTRLVNRLSNEREVLQIYKEFREKLAKASPGELDSDLLPENPEKINEIGIVQYLRDAAPAI